MRYLLDTNILVFLVLDQEELSREVRDIVEDYSNTLCTRVICIVVLLQLYRIGKIRSKYKTADALLRALIDRFSLEILPYGERQVKTLKSLQVAAGHNDPFDHAIIAHAICDQLILISSDRKFEHYLTQKLDFVFNKR